MDEVLQCAQEPKNEREMVLVFHQNDRSPVSARLIEQLLQNLRRKGRELCTTAMAA
jgi:hypothetical protein